MPSFCCSQQGSPGILLTAYCLVRPFLNASTPATTLRLSFPEHLAATQAPNRGDAAFAPTGSCRACHVRSAFAVGLFLLLHAGAAHWALSTRPSMVFAGYPLPDNGRKPSLSAASLGSSAAPFSVTGSPSALGSSDTASRRTARS